MADKQSEWWRGATLYQIYPRSFADSNGDGVGDLPGITSRLGYVASLGVDGIWLSPFFPSPMRDFGYDVSEYCDVDPLFGTLADFDALLAEAHRLGLKVVIDQVWSHTAAEHPWFVESRSSRGNPKADWYVWADARPDGSPPNNWQSWMGGPAWRWEPRRSQYHLHNFLPQMPDLNFHCAAVQDAVLDAARFWLERGVDGFRLDTANLYFHSRALEDNPPMPDGQRGDSPVLMQRHVYNADQPEAPRFFERLRALMDRFPGRMAVAEVGGADPLATMIEYTRGHDRLHTAYSFAFLGERPDAAQVVGCLEPWCLGEGAQAWPSWAFSNHDAARVATRWGPERDRCGFAFGARLGAPTGAPAAQGGIATLWLALLVALRGSIFVYQGEELGLPQSDVGFEDLRDPFGLAHWPLNPGRDGCRTPFPWQSAAPQAGFTSASRSWLPVDPRHVALAVDAQEADPASTLQASRRLLALRRTHQALRAGSFEPVVAEGALLVVRRRAGTDDLLLAFNLGGPVAQLALPDQLRGAQPLFSHEGAACAGGALHLPSGSALFLRLGSRSDRSSLMP